MSNRHEENFIFCLRRTEGLKLLSRVTNRTLQTTREATMHNESQVWNEFETKLILSPALFSNPMKLLLNDLMSTFSVSHAFASDLKVGPGIWVFDNAVYFTGDVIAACKDKASRDVNMCLLARNIPRKVREAAIAILKSAATAELNTSIKAESDTSSCTPLKVNQTSSDGCEPSSVTSATTFMPVPNSPQVSTAHATDTDTKHIPPTTVNNYPTTHTNNTSTVSNLQLELEEWGNQAYQQQCEQVTANAAAVAPATAATHDDRVAKHESSTTPVQLRQDNSYTLVTGAIPTATASSRAFTNPAACDNTISNTTRPKTDTSNYRSTAPLPTMRSPPKVCNTYRRTNDTIEDTAWATNTNTHTIHSRYYTPPPLTVPICDPQQHACTSSLYTRPPTLTVPPVINSSDARGSKRLRDESCDSGDLHTLHTMNTDTLSYYGYQLPPTQQSSTLMHTSPTIHAPTGLMLHTDSTTTQDELTTFLDRKLCSDTTAKLAAMSRAMPVHVCRNVSSLGMIVTVVDLSRIELANERVLTESLNQQMEKYLFV